MSWKKKIINAATEVAETLGNSVAYIKRQFGVTVTDEQVDAAVQHADAVTDELTKVLAAYVDSIPGVPSIVANLAAQTAMKIVDSAIAGAGEAIKARN
jgi:hypothetical protein